MLIQWAVSHQKTISGDSGKAMKQMEYCFMYKLQIFFFVVLNPPWSRNTPQDNTTSPITFDEMLELFNQLATYVGKKNYKLNFWDTEPYLKLLKPKYAKWQKVWKNRLDHYTPREKPAHEPIPIEGIIEKWDPKVAKGTPQFKTVKISPMFDKDAMLLYKTANEAYPAPAAVKNEETAESLRAVVGLDIRFMVGCDQVWDFSDDDDQPAARAPAAGPAIAALPSAAAADDAPSPPAPPVDPADFTKWNVLDLPSIPLPAQGYVADNYKARRSSHAGLLLCFMSPAMEAAFPAEAQALYAGFQEQYEHPVTVEDVRRYPSVGRNAYTPEEVLWFNATYDFLEGELDDTERAKRLLPAKKRPKRAASAGPSPAAPGPAAPSPAAASGQRKRTIEATAEDTEDEEETLLVTPISRKRGRKPR